MEDRYEIREKVGQGGLGVVLRAYDTRMRREVAIKRILVPEDDPSLKEESTRQLLKESSALASLQHPHIVTIYDVGADEEGPYVVMELISGKTLDEIIDVAPLTWTDFRELAIQTQEALIAAQELQLIHGDIKPANIMLTWLPSGKFQMKVVDFGLATLTHAQSIEEITACEEVFGSIYFMAPEQFERVPLDARTDIYCMGCVYYQALTGTYPFRGATTEEVMTAHLHQQVIPAQEIRPDIPPWVCDWIMWMINRNPSDRPESSREALQVFFQNDASYVPPINPRRAGPRRNIVHPVTPREMSQTKAISINKNTGPLRPAGPSTSRLTGPVPTSRLTSAVSVPDSPLSSTAPQQLLPPEGSKPSLYNAPIIEPEPQTYIPATNYVPQTYEANPNKRRNLIIALSAVAIIVAAILVTRIIASNSSQRLDNMLTEVSQGNTKVVSITGPQLDQFLVILGTADTIEKQNQVFLLLSLAKASDGTDIDRKIVNFAVTSTQLLPEIRALMLQNVIGQRMKPAMVPEVLEFARSSKDNGSVIAALLAISNVAGDAEFEPMLSMIQGHPNDNVRKAAEACVFQILKHTKNQQDFAKQITLALANTTNNKIREPLLRLQMATGT